MKFFEKFILSSGLVLCFLISAIIIKELKQVEKEIQESLIESGQLQKINWKWTTLPINLEIRLSEEDTKDLTEVIKRLNQDSLIKMNVELFAINKSNLKYTCFIYEEDTNQKCQENMTPMIKVYKNTKNKQIIFTQNLIHLLGIEYNNTENSILNLKNSDQFTLSETDWNLLNFVYSKDFKIKKMF